MTETIKTEVASTAGPTGEIKAQAGPSMGEHCVSDRALPSNLSEPSGEITKIDDVDVYISKPADYPHHPSKLLILLSSGTGIHSINNQIQADKYASEGFLVVMPDQFAGDAFTSAATDPDAVSEDSMTVIEKVKMGVATTAKSFMLDMWLARHTAEKVLPIVQRAIRGACEEFADAVANGGGVYAAGYCFGGKYVCLLAKDVSLSEKEAPTDALNDNSKVNKDSIIIKAGVVAHATLVTAEDLQNITQPVSFACIENDQLFPDDIREAGRQHLEKEKIPHEIRVYSGVPHGFAVVGEYSDDQIQQSQAKAFEQMINWLKAH